MYSVVLPPSLMVFFQLQLQNFELWISFVSFFRSRSGQQQNRLLCPKLVVVKTEPKEEDAATSFQIKNEHIKPYQIKPDQSKAFQIKSEQTKAYQTRPSNTSQVGKSVKSSSRKALESCLLSSSKVSWKILDFKISNILNQNCVEFKTVRRSKISKTFPSALQWRA